MIKNCLVMGGYGLYLGFSSYFYVFCGLSSVILEKC